MILHTVNDPNAMFDVYPISQLFCTTGNSVVNAQTRELVMGAGHAKQYAEFFDPTGEKKLKAGFGLAVHNEVSRLHNLGTYDYLKVNELPYVTSKDGLWRGYGAYGLIYSKNWPNNRMGILQTKFDWKKPSPLALVKWSLKRLQGFIDAVYDCNGIYIRVDMPFPGIGKGGLPRHEVLPMLENFGDYLHVWELEN